MLSAGRRRGANSGHGGSSATAIDMQSVGRAFDLTEIDVLQKTFKDLARRSPNNTVDRETFLKYFHLPGLLGEQLFVAFDTKSTGTIDIEEFLMGMAVVLRGDPEKKAQILFRMFNLASDEGISADELKTMLLTCFSSAVTLLETATESASLRQVVSDGAISQQAHQNISESPLSTSTPIRRRNEADIYLEHNLMEQNVADMVSDAFRDRSPESKLTLPEFSEWLKKHPRIVDFVFKSPSVVEHKKQLRLRKTAKHKTDADACGWLIGHSKDMFKKFARRYYVLKGVYLYKFADKSESVPKEAIFMPGAIVRELDGTGSSGSSKSASPSVAARGPRDREWTGNPFQPLSLAVPGSSTNKANKRKGAGVSSPLAVPGEAVSPRSNLDKHYALEKVKAGNSSGSIGDASPSLSTHPSLKDFARNFNGGSHRQFGIELCWDNGYSRVLYAEDAEKQHAWLKKLRIAAQNRSVLEEYKLDRESFASGGFSQLYRCHNLNSQREFAVKVAPKVGLDPVERAGMLSEVSILEMVSHPNVIGLEDVFEDSRNLYIVMELCLGGHLLDFMETYGAVDEQIARVIISQILHGLHYLHSFGIVHRDMKPKNVLFAQPPRLIAAPAEDDSANRQTASGSNSTGEQTKVAKTPRWIDLDAEIKIVDFGYSKFIRPTERLNEGVGTFKYWSPEMARGLSEYSKPVDLWGVGVILYRLVTGDFPFMAGKGEDLLQVIAYRPYIQDSDVYKALSPQCKHLISCLLEKDPNVRIDAAAAKVHPWIHQDTEAVESSFEEN
uniref:Calmodulin n=1 Tax=Timspurckia oligopyrenoides TaxID=708627 RepID=A0A7S0ZE69_9RHOD|mmetsp:Transcript_1747/g.3101  ORF Transcript_1747/g.3101 Transcript_1747/m.3101 type:complete len:783 (+) Transcript_1747:115-2463(+)|eukprot:CAMPEP_0182452298 /NCGR_PEP_ID=MMETSP1172-20130603/44174_1 /TAXON_ID=708627 /ORGANISM="Timspurckia oligopyrenoides, Strain CCMP3278" /LENGTH=782 /DNA_ID=CAMNT_0024650123 /DNA_START=47 /DNA_END=2395 /DNA_ORIENTATION=-